MGDKAALSKARQELEELYLGVPDESVDLTFKDFASAQQNSVIERKKAAMDPIREHESPMASKGTSTLGKLPSLDLAKGLQPSRAHNHIVARDEYNAGRLSPVSNRRGRGMNCSTYETSRAYDDDLSVISGVSNIRNPYDGRVRRKRPGIPHSNICTICTMYIYFFRHRCLVCGRVYCRDCVNVGMGEMTEGRKCLECLGKRFSVRYIHRAGNVGCCMTYPSRVKQQELRWAEKGPRRSGEKRYGTSRYMSRARSPELPRTPRSAHSNGSPVSFNMSAILQSPIHPHIPV